MPISIERRRRAIAEAITFDQFVDGTVNFTDDFRANYAAVELTATDRRLLEQIAEPVDVLAIVEDWCPDVVANLPIFARIAEETGAIRLHVVVRGEATRDVADSYPYEGRSHIPTYVFSVGDGEDLGVIVERTAPIRELVEQFLEAFFAAHPGIDRTSFPGSLSDEQRTELVQGSTQLRRDVRDLERSSFVSEIVEIASVHAVSTV
jgi:hypothetical protein